MTSLKDLLPAPTDGYTISSTPAENSSSALKVEAAPSSPKAGVSRVLVLPTVNNEPDYSAVVRQGENASRIVPTSHDALVEKSRAEALRPLPMTSDIQHTARRTRNALEKALSGKLVAKSGNRTTDKPSYVRYTPANSNLEHSSGSNQRIIKMVEAPVDPMEPPKFSQRKAPVNPPSPPVPVLHSPDRKLSKQEAAEWKIPPVVSNWKNNRGYTISLDKRLAAEGRGSVDHSINDRFALMAEALYKAEHKAREDVEKRARLQRQVSAKAKEGREKELRELAEKARHERKGYLALSEQTDAESSFMPNVLDRPSESQGCGAETAQKITDEAPPQLSNTVIPTVSDTPRRPRKSRFTDRVADASEVESVEDVAEARKRDEIRHERRIQRDREMRKREIYGYDGDGQMLKRSKLTRDQDRDVSERVALGQKVDGNGGSEVLYDQRLFNQDGTNSRRGGHTSLAGGYGADDAYNLYDRPLFKGANSATKFQYRASGSTNVDERERRFRADREFGGPSASGSKDAPRQEARARPVEFEKDTELKSSANDDPYGMNKFFKEARQAGK